MTNKKKINIFKQKGIHVCLSISFDIQIQNINIFLLCILKQIFLTILSKMCVFFLVMGFGQFLSHHFFFWNFYKIFFIFS